MTETISFFTENIDFNLRNKGKIRKWIRDTSATLKKRTGEVNYIFCEDDYLLEINIKYLRHNTLTDIITFPYQEKKDILKGDIYISLPRVGENSLKFGTTFDNELHRVMIHGILHLAGWNDSTREEKDRMRQEENKCLEHLERILS